MPILLCKTADNNVPDSPGKWRVGEVVVAVSDDHTFGSQETPEAGNFYHVTVTDKTLAEVQEYLQGWHHEPDTTQISAVGNDRLLEVTSTMVSASGQNAFTQAQVEGFCTGLNEQYPTANSSYDSHQNASFRFNVTVPIEQRDELIERINEFVRDVQYKRRRWYINQAGRDFMDANNNQASGPAATVGNYLRDGLLD